MNALHIFNFCIAYAICMHLCFCIVLILKLPIHVHVVRSVLILDRTILRVVWSQTSLSFTYLDWVVESRRFWILFHSRKKAEFEFFSILFYSAPTRGRNVEQSAILALSVEEIFRKNAEVLSRPCNRPFSSTFYCLKHFALCLSWTHFIYFCIAYACTSVVFLHCADT